MFTVIVQHTETLELDQFGPYETREQAEQARDAYVRIMDQKYGFLDVFSVWVVPIRTPETSMAAHRAYIDLFTRIDPDARRLDDRYYEMDTP